MKFIYPIILSSQAPENYNSLWLHPVDGKIEAKVYVNGEWTSVDADSGIIPSQPSPVIKASNVELLYGTPTLEYLSSIGLGQSAIGKILRKEAYVVTSGNYVFHVTYSEGTLNTQWCFLLSAQQRDNANTVTFKFWHNPGEDFVYIDIYGQQGTLALSYKAKSGLAALSVPMAESTNTYSITETENTDI